MITLWYQKAASPLRVCATTATPCKFHLFNLVKLVAKNHLMSNSKKTNLFRSLLTVLSLSPTLAYSAPDDGYKLIRICSVFIRLVDHPAEPANAFETSQAGECMGFMRGMRYMFRIQEAMHNSSVCMPNISNLDYVKSIVAYGNAHQELLAENETTMVVRSAAKLYPCK